MAGLITDSKLADRLASELVKFAALVPKSTNGQMRTDLAASAELLAKTRSSPTLTFKGPSVFVKIWTRSRSRSLSRALMNWAHPTSTVLSTPQTLFFNCFSEHRGSFCSSKPVVDIVFLTGLFKVAFLKKQYFWTRTFCKREKRRHCYERFCQLEK